MEGCDFRNRASILLYLTPGPGHQFDVGIGDFSAVKIDGLPRIEKCITDAGHGAGGETYALRWMQVINMHNGLLFPPNSL